MLIAAKKAKIDPSILSNTINELTEAKATTSTSAEDIILKKR